MLIEDDVIAIEDLGSTNGSFLNGKKIKKSNFSKSDELVLGDIAIKHEWLLKELQQLMKQEKFDFTVEFEELKKMQSDYKEKMKNIKKQSAITGHLFRLGITLGVIGLAFVLVQMEIMPQSGMIVVMVASASLLGILQAVAPVGKKQEVEMEEMREEFLMKYRCPKCNLAFGEQSWNVLATQARCQRCQAVWVL